VVALSTATVGAADKVIVDGWLVANPSRAESRPLRSLAKVVDDGDDDDDDDGDDPKILSCEMVRGDGLLEALTSLHCD